MKKNILLTLAFFTASTIGTFAQDTPKEYNMVITLSNGTQVTLGHNDVKDITFNDGKISISGDVATTIQELQERTKYIEDATMDNRYRHESDNEKTNATLMVHETILNDHAAAINSNADIMKQMAAYTDEKFAKNDNALIAISNYVAQQDEVNQELLAQIEILYKVIESLHPELNESPEMKALKTKATQLGHSKSALQAIKNAIEAKKAK